MTKDTLPRRQESCVHHTKVGDIVVSAVNDGIFEVSFDDLVVEDPAACIAAHTGQFRSSPPWLTINTFLIRAGGKLALVDAGFDPRTPLVGKVVDNLASIGVAPQDIDAVLMTHMHPDHELGLTDASGKAAYPNAELVVHEDEVAFWNDDSQIDRVTEIQKADFALARTALAAYRGRVREVAAGEIMPGVRAVPTPGHTPGHTAWLVESDGDSLMIWGDVIHFPGIQFAYPEASVAFDIDAKAAAAERRRVLDMVASEKTRVAGIHMDFPCFGRVVRSGSAFAHVPEIWRPAL